MSEINNGTKRVLYLVSCASRPAQRIQEFVPLAQAQGWDVCVITTPQATKFVDIPLLEQLTGHPVRSEYKRPEEPDVLPRADAIVVFPATVNTLNKWALGIMDTLALGLLCEYMGMNMPVLAIPCVLTGSGLDTHPAFSRSIAFLRGCGVRVIYEPEKYPPKNEVPWEIILDELHEMMQTYALEQQSDPNRPSGI
jgi:phosphopantothenoylcysteine synthetase/decarboxylase